MTNFDRTHWVLNKGYVQLLATSPDLSNIPHLFMMATNAARVSYMGETKGYEADLKLLNSLWDRGHGTPFEMIDFTFRVKAPIFVNRQWFRYRISSFNEQSGRYTEYSSEFYIPEYFRYQHPEDKQMSAGRLDDEDLMNEYIQIHENALSFYEELLERGVSREMARLHLPVTMYSTFYYKANFRSLAHFIQERTDTHAQWEIRQYAHAIKTIVAEVAPELWALLD